MNHAQSVEDVTPFVGVWIETDHQRTERDYQVVTPFVGVWIETYREVNNHRILKSHPSWVCGLKPYFTRFLLTNGLSHPSWVCGLKLLKTIFLNDLYVTPFVGVWIETDRSQKIKQLMLVTPFVGVWIETLTDDELISTCPSHPSWVCGLKHVVNVRTEHLQQSHPSWVCGLKHTMSNYPSFTRCHTLRGCVD